MTSKKDPTRVSRYLENWQFEVDSASQYRFLAETEKDPGLKQVFQKLAEGEEAHIVFWEKYLAQIDCNPGPRKPSWRSRVLTLFARKVNRRVALSTIASAERTSRVSYAKQPETAATPMASQERWHARVIQELMENSQSGVEGGTLARMEGRHRSSGGNALRAAVLGANDGLCSNLSLVMGVAGATLPGSEVLLTGIAGVLAGSLSMALGEYVSVASARELALREIQIEADEYEIDPQSEAGELQLIYQAKGLTPEEAKATVDQLLKNPSKLLDTLSREELGINPEDLGGSAFEAAFTSFLLFAAGALIPVLPFFFLQGSSAVILSLALSAIALFGIGALITVFTGRSAWFSGGRQLLLGVAAAAATYAIGSWIGAAIRG
ncbi:MAG: VIT1/CCC1 transporter family protein [Bdellovibrio sp.]|nr:VIT1/CCC1 transporter family protein [Bdellovibrio sp.]